MIFTTHPIKIQDSYQIIFTLIFLIFLNYMKEAKGKCWMEVRVDFLMNILKIEIMNIITVKINISMKWFKIMPKLMVVP